MLKNRIENREELTKSRHSREGWNPNPPLSPLSLRGDKRGVIGSHAVTCNTGVTLVEVLISLVVLLIVFMGLIQASMLTLDVNMRNEVRDEAVRISSEFMSRTKAASFTTSFTSSELSETNPKELPATIVPTTSLIIPSGGGVINPVPRQFRNMWATFTVERSIMNLDTTIPPTNKKIGIRVSWTYRNEPFNHAIYSSMRAAE